MTPKQACNHIRLQQGGARPFRLEQRGFIDWKFGELAEHLGFERAEQYASAASRWWDKKAVGSNLLISYFAFLEAD